MLLVCVAIAWASVRIEVSAPPTDLAKAVPDLASSSFSRRRSHFGRIAATTTAQASCSATRQIVEIQSKR